VKVDSTPASIGATTDQKTPLPDESTAAVLSSASSGQFTQRGSGRPPGLDRKGFAARPAKLVLLTVLPVTIVAAGIFAFTQMNTPKVTAPDKLALAAVTVTTCPAKLDTLHDFVVVTGSVSAWDPLSIGAEVSGLRMTAVNVEEGDYVKKGQILATLNSGVLQAQLAQAKARLSSAQANFKKAIQPNRSEDINALSATLAQEEANINEEQAHRKEFNVNLTNAETNAKRWLFLADTGAVSPVDGEAKQLAADAARQELAMSDAKIKAARALSNQAREKLLEAQRGGRSEDIAISRATIAETSGQIEQLEEQIKQTVIKAPDDGLVAKRDAHIGDIANAGAPLFSLIRLNRLELRAQVPDIDLSKFKTGQAVKISTNENDGNIVGRVSLVSPQVDLLSRQGTVRIKLPADAGLKPGMFVRGQVDLGQHSGITVPVRSVVTRNGESFVFALDGDRAASIAVVLGARTDTTAEVLKGLSPGQVIINEGARFLSDRDIVRVGK